MRRNLPPLNALRAFEAAGRHGSFTRAAKELNVSHSVISRHVRGLEQRLEAQLFRTVSRGVALTERGKRYLQEITPAFDQIARAGEMFREEAVGQVTINSDHAFAERWLMPRLGAFREKYPGIRLDITSGSALANLAQHEVDIALRFFRHSGEAGDAPLLIDTLLHPYGAPGCGFEDACDPRRFLKAARLVDRNEDPWRQWFAQAGVVDEEIPDTPRDFHSGLALAATVSGQGVILTGEELIERELAEGRLVMLSEIGIRAGSYHVLYREGARRQQSVRLFADWLLEEAARFRDAIVNRMVE